MYIPSHYAVKNERLQGDNCRPTAYNVFVKIALSDKTIPATP